MLALCGTWPFLSRASVFSSPRSGGTKWLTGLVGKDVGPLAAKACVGMGFGSSGKCINRGLFASKGIPLQPHAGGTGFVWEEWENQSPTGDCVWEGFADASHAVPLLHMGRNRGFLFQGY